MSDIELAWAAGFFDGEGWTYANKTELRLRCAQKDPRPLRRFQAAVGEGHLTSARTYGVAPNGTIWRWAASGQGATRALVKLLPYLSEPKREQAAAALRKVIDAA